MKAKVDGHKNNDSEIASPKLRVTNETMKFRQILIIIKSKIDR